VHGPPGQRLCRSACVSPLPGHALPSRVAWLGPTAADGAVAITYYLFQTGGVVVLLTVPDCSGTVFSFQGTGIMVALQLDLRSEKPKLE
jgi:hypothetical protein